MSPLWKGILSVLTGGISNIFTNGGFSNLGKILSNAGDTASDLGNQNILGNYVAKQTGSRLTDAEREANVFTAQREDIAWQRNLEASNTAYQRQVDDLRAAGINPLMAVGNGVSLPSASSSGSVSPAGGSSLIGDIISILQAKGQLSLLKSEKELKDAEADKLRSETKGQDLSNEIKEATKHALIRAAELDNELKDVNVKYVYRKMDEASANIDKLIKETETESYKQMLLAAQSILENAKANEINVLLPYREMLMEAEGQQARAAAAYSFIQTAVQKKLLDGGYFDSMISSAASQAGMDLDNQTLLRIKTAIRNGESLPNDDKGIIWNIFSAEGFVSNLSNIIDLITAPVAGLLK